MGMGTQRKPFNLTKKEVTACIAMLELNNFQRLKNNPVEKFRKNVFQTNFLNNVYKICKFPSTNTRKNIGLIIGVLPRVIQVWFQNKRQKNKNIVDDESCDFSSEVDEMNTEVSIIKLLIIYENILKKT